MRCFFLCDESFEYFRQLMLSTSYFGRRYNWLNNNEYFDSIQFLLNVGENSACFFLVNPSIEAYLQSFYFALPMSKIHILYSICCFFVTDLFEKPRFLLVPSHHFSVLCFFLRIIQYDDLKKNKFANKLFTRFGLTFLLEVKGHNAHEFGCFVCGL